MNQAQQHIAAAPRPHDHNAVEHVDCVTHFLYLLSSKYLLSVKHSVLLWVAQSSTMKMFRAAAAQPDLNRVHSACGVLRQGDKRFIARYKQLKLLDMRAILCIWSIGSGPTLTRLTVAVALS